jgi:DNA repair protein RadA/Sms
VAIGEVGLLGELRAVTGLGRRLREAARLGYRRAIVPRATARDAELPSDFELVPVATLREAIERALGPRERGREGDSAAAVLVAPTNGGD